MKDWAAACKKTQMFSEVELLLFFYITYLKFKVLKTKTSVTTFVISGREGQSAKMIKVTKLTQHKISIADESMNTMEIWNCK
jgi:hypothetical protein